MLTQGTHVEMLSTTPRLGVKDHPSTPQICCHTQQHGTSLRRVTSPACPPKGNARGQWPTNDQKLGPQWFSDLCLPKSRD